MCIVYLVCIILYNTIQATKLTNKFKDIGPGQNKFHRDYYYFLKYLETDSILYFFFYFSTLDMNDFMPFFLKEKSYIETRKDTSLHYAI